MVATQLIEFLRTSVGVQDSESTNPDSEFVSMSYEELETLLMVVVTRDFPEVQSLDSLPTEYIYPVVLLAKKELYYVLASKYANKYDLGADNNNYLKRSQMYDHYLKLIEQVDKEYKDYQENGAAGGNTLTSFDVLLSNRYGTKRNYELGVTPAPVLYVDNVCCTTVELSWFARFSRFESYTIYLSTAPIIDDYAVGDKISAEAKKVIKITDVHQTSCRIEGLTPGTQYYVAIAAREASSLTGYKEETFTTKPVASVKI